MNTSDDKSKKPQTKIQKVIYNFKYSEYTTKRADQNSKIFDSLQYNNIFEELYEYW